MAWAMEHGIKSDELRMLYLVFNLVYVYLVFGIVLFGTCDAAPLYACIESLLCKITDGQY